MTSEQQIAELRAAVEALTARVEALEAFPRELLDAFNEQLAAPPQDVPLPASRDHMVDAFIGDAPTAGGSGGGARPALLLRKENS